MSEFISILPPNSSPGMRAREEVLFRASDLEVLVGSVWDPEICPESHLAWLAWALSVDNWDAAWPVERKRTVIAEAVAIHRVKGTIGSIRRAIAAFGYGAATILEGQSAVLLDGSTPLDGSQDLGEVQSWAEYRVYLSRPITAAQAQQLRDILAEIAPARCVLAELNFVEAQGVLDGSIPLDGTFTLGVA